MQKIGNIEIGGKISIGTFLKGNGLQLTDRLGFGSTKFNL